MSVAPSKALSPRDAYRQALKKPARRKYGNTPVVTEEGRFDSQKEHRRWCDLKALERAGHISGLERQVRFPLEINGQVVGAYVADAVYHEDGVKVIEDVKSAATRAEPTYRLKAKIVRAIYGITIREV